MSSIVRNADIAADVGTVWAILEDVRLLPRLSPSTKAVEGAPARLTSPGQVFRQVVHLLGRDYESDWEVKTITTGRLLSIEGSVGLGVSYCLTEEVEPVGPDSTRLRVSISYRLPFGPLGRVAARLGVEQRAATECAQVVEGVKRMAEARASAAA